MFKTLEEKCSVCKMRLEKGKNYLEESGKKFCSEKCKEKYKEESEESSKHSGGCCS